MRRIFFAIVASLALTACGGGGNGVSSAGSTVPVGSGGTGGSGGSPPTNSTITDLIVGQTFTGDATISSTRIGTGDGVVTTTAQKRTSLEVRYDAVTKSYTVSTDGRSQTFAPSDIQPGSAPGETRYQKHGAGTDYLTLVTTPYYGTGTSNRYVGMGYWQHNDIAGGTQAMEFATFTYGLGTSASGVPRSGTAAWATDIFGLLTTPGQELRTVQGRGSFDVDFGAGVFSAFANLDEFDLITGGGRVGSLRFRGGGQLRSGNGFSGDFSYASGRSGTLGGSIAGQFYGPSAEEVGATFNATGNGAVLTGAMTGQRDLSLTPATQTLLNIQSAERLGTTMANFMIVKRDGETGFSDVKAFSGNSAFVAVAPGGVTEISNGSLSYVVKAEDIVADGRTNFTTYRPATTSDAEYAIYKVGTANNELALTYLSFATWTRTTTNLGQTSVDMRYLPFGIATPAELLAARTGSGRYEGVVYGSGASLSGASYDVTGSSRFDVDFTNASYSGGLALNGKAPNGSVTDFGSFAFSGALYEGALTRAGFEGKLAAFNYIEPRFYGSGAQEIGATFQLSTRLSGQPDDVLITGVALAKQQ